MSVGADAGLWQLMLQNYLEDPSISFCAIGDAADGVAPLQVCNFAQVYLPNSLVLLSHLLVQGGALDREIGKIWVGRSPTLVFLIDSYRRCADLSGRRGQRDGILRSSCILLCIHGGPAGLASQTLLLLHWRRRQRTHAHTHCTHHIHTT